MHHGTEAVVNILDLPLNGEGATRSDGHPPQVGALLRSAGDNGAHDIACLKPIRQAVRFGSRAREAVLIHPAHLARLSAGRGNEKRNDAFNVKRLRRACSDTRGIQPVRFRQSPARAVPLRAPARAYFHGKSKRLQATVQFPPCRVHGGGVLERSLCLSQDPFQALGLVRKKVLDELRPLPVIARLAGDGEVAHPVRPAPLPAEDVLDFHGHLGRIAIGAPSSPLLHGVKATVSGRVGSDVFGDFIIGDLQANGIDTSGIGRSATAGTSKTVVLPVIGQDRIRRRTQVRILATRLSRDGGSQCFGLARLEKRGFR